jgi:hypothetical protein
MNISNIDKALASLLQHNIKLNVADKTIRQGKLILYTIKDYVVTITLRNHKKQLKTYDVYYPYRIEEVGRDIIFDYKLSTLFNDHDPLIDSLAEFAKNSKNHKLFDRELRFTVS